MNNDINTIIDNLSNKFGTTAPYLIQEIGKYYMAKGIVCVISAAIIFIISFYFLQITIKKFNEEMKKEFSEQDEEPYIAGAFICGVGLFFATILLIISINKLVGWIISPTAGTIDLILDYLSN